jgi:hypothetical protein
MSFQLKLVPSSVDTFARGKAVITTATGDAPSRLKIANDLIAMCGSV